MKVFHTQKVLKTAWMLCCYMAIHMEVFGQCPTEVNTLISKVDEQCFNAKDGQIIFEFTDGVAPDGTIYRKRLWNYDVGAAAYDDNNPFIPNAPTVTIAGNQLIFSDLKPGDYALLLNGGACSADPNNPDIYGYGYSGGFNSAIQIAAATDIVINAGAINTTDNVKCLAPYSGEIDMSGAVSGGAGSYQYSLDTGTTYQASPIFSNLLNGTYAVRVKDANACTKDENGIVINDSRVAPIANISPDPAVVCPGANLNLNGNPGGGTGPYTHSWTGDTGPLSATNIPNPVFNSAVVGTFNLTYTVTDANGCSTSDVITVNVNQDDASFSYAKYDYCQSETNPLPNNIATPGGTFSAPAGLVFVDAATGEIDLAASTVNTYTITYTTAGPCPASSTHDVSIYAVPPVNNLNLSVCEDSPGIGTATVDLTSLNPAIDGGAGYTISWYTDAGLTTPVADETNVTVINNDDFYAQVDDGTCQNVATVIYAVNDYPVNVSNLQIQNISCTSFDVSWDPATGADDYIVEVIDVDAGSTFAAPDYTQTIVAPATTATFPGLTEGTQYQLRVRGRNSCGEGNNTVAAVFATDALPTQPTGLSATNVSCTSFDATWNPAADAATYTVELYADAALTTLLATQSVADPATSTTFPGLTNGTTYYFRIRSENACGASAFTSAANVTIDTTPADPANPVASTISCTDFDASWDAATGAVSYVVEYIDVDAGGNFATPDGTQTVMAPVTTANISGLTAGTQYQFRVRASNACGESNNVTSAVFSTNAAPVTPTGLTVFNPTCNGFDASWNAVAGANTYTIEVYSDAGLTTLVDTQTIPGTSLTYNTLNNSTTYYVQVRAENTCGNSAFTAATNIATDSIPADPANVQAINIKCTDFDASWDAATGAASYVVEYINVDAGGNFAAPDGTQTVMAPATTGNIIGLAAGTQYQFRVRASNACGESNNVTSAVFATNPLPTANSLSPGVCEDSPGIGTATVDLTSLNPAIDGGAGYTISWYTDAGLTTPVADETNVTVSDGQNFYAQVDDGTCQNTATVSYTVNTLDDSGFSYSAGTFCQDAVNPVATVTGTPGGTFSAAPAGLVFADVATGEIDLAGSTAGSYTVTYTTAGACPTSTNVPITVNTAEDASFSYSAGTFCQDAVNPVATVTGTPGGTFSAAPAGLVFADVATGEIDLAASTVNTYTVTYTTAGPCPASSSKPVTITTAPDATFSYSQASYCQDAANPVATAAPGAGLGVFTAAPAGLVFADVATGEIDLAGSTAGSYTVTNFIGASGGCSATSYNVLVEIRAQDDASFTYANNTFCHNQANPLPNSITTPGGVFSATPGLVFVNPSTGEIDLIASIAGSYTITYTTGGACSNSQDFPVTINSVDDAAFSYPSTRFCQDEANPVPDVVNTPGGTFSATPGLVFVNPSTGEIDLAASMPGNYTLTYQTAGTCPNTNTFDITIDAVPVANAGSDGASCSLEYTLGAVVPAFGTGQWSAVSLPSGTATASFDDATASDALVTVNEAGNYTFQWKVTNGNCVDSATVQVNFTMPITITKSGGNGAMCDPVTPIGYINITVTGGSGNYDILWSNGEGVMGGTGSSAAEDLAGGGNGVPGGVYTVEVTDTGTGCDTVGIFAVENWDIGGNLTLTGSDATCAGGLGQIDLQFAGTGPYNIYYINSKADTIQTATKTNFGSGTINDVVTDLPADVYYIHVDDIGYGCSLGDTVSIKEPVPVTFNVNSTTNVTCNGGSDGSIDISVAGGTPGYSYQWFKDGVALGGVTVEDPTGILAAGSYYVEVTDGNTCVTTSPIMILTEPAPEAAPIAKNASAIGCNTFTAHWSDEGVTDYYVDVATDPGFIPASLHPDYTNYLVNDTSLLINTNIAPQTAYYYRVRAVKSCGTTISSNLISVTTIAPESTVTTAATYKFCDQFTANWVPVGSAVNYFVEVAEDNGFATMLPGFPATIPAGTDSLNVTGLTPGASYFYRVQVESACGTSVYSNTTSVTLMNAPAQPAGLSPGNPVCDGFDITWNPDPDAASYLIEVDDNPGFGSLDFNTTVVSSNVTVTGLLPQTTYFYRITAINGCDSAAAVDVYNTRNLPSTPVIVDANPACDGFDISWTGDADSYLVEVSSDAFATVAASLSVMGTDATFTGLNQGTTYDYRITPINSCGSGTAATGTLSTADTPVVPAGVTASNPACDGFKVSWNAVVWADKYVVEVSTDGFGTVDATLTVTGTDTTFTTLLTGTTYAYHVKAVNACGESAFSADQPFDTNPANLCGCGHDMAQFIVNPVNINCLGSEDGALLINLLPATTASPDRFTYKYRSLTNVADSSDWKNGATAPGLVWAFDSLAAGDYIISIKDNNAQAGCQEILELKRTISVQNNVTVNTKAETCTGSDGAISLSVPSSCQGIEYNFLWTNLNNPTESIVTTNNTKEASNLQAGDYQIIVSDNITGIKYDTLFVTVPDNCSTNGGGEPSAICDLGDKTVDFTTTAASCDTGEGSVTFIIRGGESNQYSFRIFNEAGSVDETQTATGSVTFNSLPAGDYDYVVIDASGNPRCQSNFKITEKVVVISSLNYTLPQCDAPQQVATLEVTLGVATTAPAPYDVYAIHENDTVSVGMIETGANSTVLTGLPTGATYEVVVQSRAAGTCSGSKMVEIPSTGVVDISFDYDPLDITCYGEGGAVTITNLVVAEDVAFTINLYKIGQDDPYASRILQIVPSSYTFADLEKGEYQLQVVQQQTSCGALIKTKRSSTFIIDGPNGELTAEIPDIVRVSVNDPKGDILIGNISGGGLSYEVRIATDPNGESTDWIEVMNENQAIDEYEYTFKNLERGKYIIQVRDRFGCMLTHTVEIRYTEDLYIPNIFTPNGDGENDTFRIINLPITSDTDGVKMIITNRWGRVIYKSDNYTNEKAWDGEDYADGIYFYRLILPNEGGAYSGWVEIWKGKTP